LLVLVKTWLDVIALRKGPDAVPASWIVFVIAVVLFAAGWLVQVVVYGVNAATVYAALIAYVLALAFYAAVASLFGFRRRLVQMLSTLIACGSLIALTSAAVALLLAPVAGVRVSTMIATIVWFWSVPVKGHIVSRTIERHWFLGIAIAMLAYMLRFAVESSFVTSGNGAL
jgi:hypothetical protein